jgi:hypothetical protein
MTHGSHIDYVEGMLLKGKVSCLRLAHRFMLRHHQFQPK